MKTFLCVLILHLSVPAPATTCPPRCTCNTLEDSLIVDCSNVGFMDIPTSQIPQNATKLKFEGNRISALSAGSFTGLDRIVDIDLSNNQISNIENNTFQAVALSLQVLKLGHNRIEKVETGLFSGLSLSSLVLSHNDGLSEISPGAFSDSSIEQIELDYCSLTWMDIDTFKDLKYYLKFLYLSNNKVRVNFQDGLYTGFQFSKVIMNNNSLGHVDILNGAYCEVLELNANNIRNNIWILFQIVE